jgi:integrase
VAKDRYLTSTELNLYWNELSCLSPLIEITLKVQLLLAGQRFTQLTDITWKDFDEEFRIITLNDTKGRNGTGQPHILPLSDKVLGFFHQLRAWNYDYIWPFTNKGKSSINVTEASKGVAQISKKLQGSHNIEPFSFGDIRRTCETTLARLRVNKETRAHLLSHGRAVGVQSVHYDRYDYFDEKKEALALWEKHLDKIFMGNDS